MGRKRLFLSTAVLQEFPPYKKRSNHYKYIDAKNRLYLKKERNEIKLDNKQVVVKYQTKYSFFALSNVLYYYSSQKAFGVVWEVGGATTSRKEVTTHNI